MLYYGSKKKRADFEELSDLFLDLTPHLHDAVYLVDGLDEMIQPESAQVMSILRHLADSMVSGTQARLFLSSRDDLAPGIDVEEEIPDLLHITISAAKVEKDIELYIDTRIKQKSRSFRKLTIDTELTKMIKTGLYEGAQGMYVSILIPKMCLCMTNCIGFSGFGCNWTYCGRHA